MKLFYVYIALAFAAAATAQIPSPSDAPKPRSPSESAASFRLPREFKMEVVASEPQISSPSGVCWDEKGRMFVSELHGYNLEGQLEIDDLNKSGKLDTQVRRTQAAAKYKQAAESGVTGSVKLLKNSQGSGRMDQSVEWATGLPPVYGLVPARGGIIVACAPHIIYLADRDGDDRAEVREILFTGFKTGALERGINAPQWGPDGWIYFGRGWGGGQITGPKLPKPVTLPNSDFRIRPDGSAIEPVTGGTQTFGFAFDETGDRFVVDTTNPGIFIAPLPWHYLGRNPNAITPSLELRMGDKRVYPLAPPHPWRQKRADDAEYSKYYRDRYGAADSDASGWLTSACSPFIYLDHVLPGLHGNYFVCEPSGNLIHREQITRDGSALKLSRPAGEEKSEFAATADSWSHPIFLSHGPDGAIWVVDYYREIIEDYSAIPRHLQQQYGVYAGNKMGRIYRLTSQESRPPASSNLDALDNSALARETASPLLWRRQTAQRLLVERKAVSAAADLRAILRRKESDPTALITAARALDQLHSIAPADLIPLIHHAEMSVRVHALQLSDRWLRTAEGNDLLESILTHAELEKDGRALIQFALTLGESSDPRAFKLLTHYARQNLAVRWMDSALLSSLSGRETDLLADLLNTNGASQAFLESLAKTIAARRKDDEFSTVLKRISSAPPASQAGILRSLALGRKNAPLNKLADKAARESLASFSASGSDEVRLASKAVEATFLPALSDSDGPGAGKTPPVTSVSDTVFRQYVTSLNGPRDNKRGHEIFLQACSVCHKMGEEGSHFGPDLLGELGVAEETLVRHILLPNEHIRPGFETTLVETRGSDPVAGILKDDGATSLTLALPGGAQFVALRKDILSVKQLPASLMPSFAEALSPADLANVLSWLRSQLTNKKDTLLTYPKDAGILDVKSPEFGAKGDGVTDDTAAIQRALTKYPNGRLIVYLPRGIYLISDTLRWPKGPNGWEYKNIGLRGESGQSSIIQLKDRCPGFTNSASPKGMIWTGPAPAQRFGNNIRNLTIHAGSGNPGAIGIQFNASNSGDLTDVTITSGDGGGATALDMQFANEVGPLMVKRLTVEGFDYGIRTGHGINSQTFENVRLKGQKKRGWLNEGQVVSARHLNSENDVTALESTGGTVTLIDGDLRGLGLSPSNQPALQNSPGGKFFLRNINVSGYAMALLDKKSSETVPLIIKTNLIREYVAQQPSSLFETPLESLGLAVEETPEPELTPLESWTSPTHFGARPSDSRDDTEALEKALRSGKPVVYLPNGADQGYPSVRGGYVIAKSLTIPLTVNRLLGCGASIGREPYWDQSEIVIEEGNGAPLFLEDMNLGRIINRSSRVLIIKHCEIASYQGEGIGKVFFEDVVTGPVRIRGQRAWARQFNPEVVDRVKEGFGPHIVNEAGQLWILGLKTEGGGTLLETRGGGSSEVLGAHFYTTHKPNDNRDPMFINNESSLSVTGSECNFGAPPYAVYVQEIQQGKTNRLAGSQLPANYGAGKSLPLYIGRKPK